MIRVGILRASVVDALEANERVPSSPRLLHRLESLLLGRWPVWASDELAGRLRALKHLELQALPHGLALGVISLSGPGEATLLLIRVSQVELDRDPEPLPPPGLRSDAVDGLYEGAALALHLGEQHDVRDPRRALRFQVSHLDGSPLDASSPIEGRSLGLSAFIATWSLLARRPVRTGLVFSGVVGPLRMGGVIEAVQGLASKSLEVLAAGARFVVPRDNLSELCAGIDVVAVGSAQQALEAAFGVDWDHPDYRPPQAQDPAVVERQLEADYWAVRGGWASLGERFERFAERPGLSARRRGNALARAGACWTHLNEAERARNLLERGEQLLESERARLRHEDAVVIANHLAVFYRDAYRFGEAIHRLESVLKGTDPRSDEVVNARSTIGQILICMGRWDEGLPLVRAAREHYDDEQAASCSRNHCYVIEAFSRAGQMQDARKEYALGLQHNRERNASNPDALRRNQAFLYYARWNGELRAIRGTRELARWDQLAAETEWLPGTAELGPWPGIALERVRDAVRLRRLRTLEDRERIRQSALTQTASQQPLFTWHRGLVSVEAALSEMERGGDLALAQRWAEEGLRLMPSFESARLFFAPYVQWIREASDTEQLLAALKALLDAEQY